MQSIHNKNIPLIILFLDTGLIDINKQIDGSNIFITAMMNNNIEITKLFYNYRVDIEIANEFMEKNAAHNKQLNYLLDIGIDPVKMLKYIYRN